MAAARETNDKSDVFFITRVVEKLQLSGLLVWSAHLRLQSERIL